MERLILSLAFLLAAGDAAAGSSVVSGDAKRGAALFSSQSCDVCHSVNGRGGKSAPDLGTRTGRNYTPALLATRLWNHAPAMWSAMRTRGVEPPALTEQQAADLFAFFFSVRFFDAPGDAGRGKRFFDSNCSSCHSPNSGVEAKPVREWSLVDYPISLASQMWNHAAQMRPAFERKGLKWPVLTAQDLTDLTVYVQNLPEHRHQAQSESFAFVNPQAGEAQFQSKGCATCHVGSLSLDRRKTAATQTAIAAAMWNHAPKMTQMAQLSAADMKQLVGHIWSRQMYGTSGDVQRGARVFSSRRCGSCHAAPAGVQSPVSLMAALFQHGPKMQDEMKAKNMEWPRLRGSDLEDLLAYINEPRAPGGGS